MKPPSVNHNQFQTVKPNLFKLSLFALVAAGAPLPTFAADSGNTVVLDETGVKNLKLESVVAEESDFEETVFALGQIESIPTNAGAVSSRISGKIVELAVGPGDLVAEGQVVAKVESRQPGDPPPVIPLKSPLSGTIVRSEARLGEPVEPDKSLLEIIDLSQVYAISQIPEHQAGKMKPGTKAHIRVAAIEGKVFEGELLRFGVAADTANGTVGAIFRLDNANGSLRPGMRAEFSVVTSRRDNVLSVPRAALQGEASNRFVYVKDFDLANAFVKTPVQIGQMNDRMVEIVAGLFPGDEVVTRGAYSLAFAGGGSVSLKAALDAAHGHEHAADGSEMKKGEGKEAGEAGHDHEAEDKATGGGLIWKVGTGLFAALFAASLIRRKKASEEDEHADESMEVKSHKKATGHAE